MAQLPNVERCVRINIPISVAGNSHCLNRIFIHYSGTTPTGSDLNTFCNSVATAWGTNLKSLANTNTIQGPITAQELSTNSGPIGAGTTSNTGTRTGTSLTAATSVNVRFQIARRYRGGKPKVFLPFGVVGDLSNQTLWGSSFVSAVGTGWANFMTAVLAAGWSGAGTLEHENVSYYSGFTAVVNPITGRYRNVPTLRATPVQDTITGYSVDSQVGSQRRRNLNT